MATTRPGGDDDEAIARTALGLRLAVGRTARRLRREAGGGLTPSQAAILDTVARRGPISPSKIADAEQLTRSAISRVVARLRADGLVVIAPDPRDRRSYLISLSEKGVELRNTRRAQRETYLATLLERARPVELALLERAATVLLGLLEEDDT